MMMRFMFFISLIIPIFALGDPNSVRGQVQSDLELSLSKLLPKERFLVQVNSVVDTVSEKVLSEGESITALPNQTTEVPPLPGFTPQPQEIPKNVGQTRQTYKMVEKNVLKSLNVSLILDDVLSDDQLEKAQKLVQDYLNSNYSSKAALQITKMPMRQSPVNFASYLPWIVTGLLSLVLLGILGFVIYIASFRRKKNREPFYPERIVDDVKPADERPLEISSKRAVVTSALPAGDGKTPSHFAPLPATPTFASIRVELLQMFLKHADIFRLYFLRLSIAAQIELYSALRGPAFDSLLESLNIDVPQEGSTSVPPSEEQMTFYQKNFDEFIQTSSWQNDQFFGFLCHLTHEQLKTLVMSQNSFVGALMLKFMKPHQSASVLGGLPSEKRAEIIGQFQRIRHLSADELQSIELSVRKQISVLPNYILTSQEEDVEFWAKILTLSDKQEEILMHLEQVKPELYKQLARFRFKLDDLPSLPTPLIQKVLDNADNDELTKGMADLPKDLVDFVLSHLNPKRRDLIEAQLMTHDHLPREQLVQHKQQLTVKFREMMT